MLEVKDRFMSNDLTVSVGFGEVRVAHQFSYVFFLCLVCSMLPMSLDCPLVIAPSGFSNVYLYFKFDNIDVINIITKLTGHHLCSEM